MKKFSAFLILPLFALAFALNAHSALLGVTDLGTGSSAGGAAAAIIPPPPHVLDDVVTNTVMQGFNENRTTTSRDHVIDGSGALPAGTAVDSHMIFLNSAGNRRITHYNVEWTFAAPILGVMSDPGGTLEEASSFELGNPLTNYTTTFPGSGLAAPFGSRGLEMLGNPANRDGYRISSDRLSITVGMEVTEPGDWIRVVTHVPIPGAVWLLGSGLIGLVILRRRMKA